MRTNPTARPYRIAKLLGAALLALTLVALPIAGSAAPSSDDAKASLESAKAKLGDLQQQTEVLTEEYNEARVKLEEINARLDQAQKDLQQANQEAQDARALLDARTADAFTVGAGSHLEVVLGEGTFTDFTDRMTFLEVMQQDNQELALQAENAGQRAAWASADLKKAQEEQKEQQQIIADRKAEIEKLVGQQQALVEKYEIQYETALEAEREAARAAAAAADGGESGGGGSGGGYGNAPAPSSAAGVAVQTALDQVGDEYQWGAAGPDEFDCSGLTMYAWARAGVSLPHSSGSQYAMLPRVDKSDLQPGDLVFYAANGSTISHVAMYIGGNQIVHAYSEGSPVSVDTFSSYWTSAYVGAGRPG